MTSLRTFFLSLLTLGSVSCASGPAQPLLQPISTPVDLQRFMGSWYVLAAIPIDIPLLPMFSERGAHNGVETYHLSDDGTIETTYVFRRDGFDGPEQRFTPRATVANPPVNSAWKMKFKWYLPAGDYLIAYLAPDYQTTIIGVPDRKYVWVMARTAQIPAAAYAELLRQLQLLGYDPAKLITVPQQLRAAAPGAAPPGPENP